MKAIWKKEIELCSNDALL